MAAFIPEALSLRYGKKNLLPEELGYPFQAVEICPRNIRFAEDLTHRDFLGAVLNLGDWKEQDRWYSAGRTSGVSFCTDRNCRAGQPGTVECAAYTGEMPSDRTRGSWICSPHRGGQRHSFFSAAGQSAPVGIFVLKKPVVRLIEGAKVFVNGKLITSNGYQVKETDLISVRGMGKFRYIGTGGKTKKNRLSVEIERYIWAMK